MRILLSFGFLFCSFFSNGQSPSDSVAYLGIIAEEPASFLGGEMAMRQFIKEHLVYTPQMVGVQGKCFLQFVIDTSGFIMHIEVKRGVPDCPDCDKAAIRVLEIMPQWIPQKIAGKPTASYYNLPIVFKL